MNSQLLKPNILRTSKVIEHTFDAIVIGAEGAGLRYNYI